MKTLRIAAIAMGGLVVGAFIFGEALKLFIPETPALVRQLVDSTFASKPLADSLGNFVSYHAKFHTDDSTALQKDTVSFELEINGGLRTLNFTGTAVKTKENWQFSHLKRDWEQ